jgi:hypothetical protein
MGNNQEVLKSLVDACSLEGVMEMLATICAEKAEHPGIDWQDPRSAQRWLSAATRLSQAKPFFERLGL